MILDADCSVRSNSAPPSAVPATGQSLAEGLERDRSGTCGKPCCTRAPWTAPGFGRGEADTLKTPLEKERRPQDAWDLGIWASQCYD